MMSEHETRLGRFFDTIYSVGPDGIPVFKMYIDGAWVSSSDNQVFDIYTPIDGSVIARAPAATVSDVNVAVDSALESQTAIREIGGIERIEIFEQASKLLLGKMNEFTRILTLEAGKTKADAEAEVKATAERMRLTMEEARKIFGEYIPGDWCEDTPGKIALVIREPVGVVATISPFNYPLYIGAAKIIPAILAGNTVVSKQSSINPLSNLMFTRVLEAAGLPHGVLNSITGTGKIGNALVTNEKISMISFTGSTDVGRNIAQSAGLKKLHLELGGKGMAIVLDDADLKLAAQKVVLGTLKNAGQRCDSISGIFVAEKIGDRFVNFVLKEAEKFKLGDPKDPSVRLGPVIHATAVQKIHGLVEDAVSKGAKLLKGGKYRGNYYEATVLDHVPLSARIVWEETFGPVITIVRISGEDEAIEIGKKSRYGLDSCVFTTNFYRMWRIAKKLKVGEITVNDLPSHGVGFFPYGGTKESGKGREGIGYSIDELTELKTIVFNLEPAKLGKITHYYPRL